MVEMECNPNPTIIVSLPRFDRPPLRSKDALFVMLEMFHVPRILDKYVAWV
jgi:hypothetical protein